MTHDEAAAELSALIDGALGEPRKREVEAHLAGCAPCRERLAELRASIALFRSHGRREAPAALKTRVLAQARGAGAEPTAGMAAVWKPALGWSFAVAAVLFVSAGALRKMMPVLFEEQSQSMISG